MNAYVQMITIVVAQHGQQSESVCVTGQPSNCLTKHDHTHRGAFVLKLQQTTVQVAPNGSKGTCLEKAEAQPENSLNLDKSERSRPTLLLSVIWTVSTPVWISRSESNKLRASADCSVHSGHWQLSLSQVNG